MATTPPTSQLPSYAEAVSSETYVHEPMYITMPLAYRTDSARRRDPPVQDIGAGDQFVAFVDRGMRKVIKKIIPGR